MATKKLTKKKAQEAAMRKMSAKVKSKGKCPHCNKAMNKCECKGY